MGAEHHDPEFPTFAGPPPGGVTAWYTMRLAAIAADGDESPDPSVTDALRSYEVRDASRVTSWNAAFRDNDLG